MDPIDLRRIAEEAMRTHGLLPAFSQQVLHEAEVARRRPRPAEADVRDLRSLPWFSIDNDDTRDLDQLSVAEALPDGASRLRVAVADVDVLVRPASGADTHAAINTTSVYTAAGVFPMLPEAFSNDLTSLHESQERMAVVVDMRIEADGTVGPAEIHRAVVVNEAKLTYDTVSPWLDGEADPPPKLARLQKMQEQVKLHDDIAQRLRQWRVRQGALTIRTVSARPQFEDGRLVDLRPDEKNRAKDLIADVMIAANSAVARYLSERGFPSVRRVLEAPRRWDRIVAIAASHGGQLPAQPDRMALEAFLRARREADPDAFPDLSLSIVKMLGAGEYAPALPGDPAEGHFGLAVNDYAHSTAPNRRYTDLVTQRLLKAAISGQPPPYTPEALAGIARHCTVQENAASKVERHVLKAAASLLLHDRIGDTFDALVTGAAAKGTFVRITHPLVEGRLVRGFEGMDVGDKLQVRLLALDPVQGYIDFERA